MLLRSMLVTNQTEEEMLKGICDKYHEKFDIMQLHSAMKNKWCRFTEVGKLFAMYLAASEPVINGNNSGGTDEELVELKMIF